MLIPEVNAKDLVEISETIKKHLEIIPVSRTDEVLTHAYGEDGSGLTAHWADMRASLARSRNWAAAS